MASDPRGTVQVSRLLMFAAALLFVLAAFAHGGHEFLAVTDWTWGFAGFAAVALAWAAP